MLKVSASPHIRHKDSTAIIMRRVVISLIPAIIAAIYFFGARALAVVVVSVVSSVVFEYLARKIMKRESSIDDWSAVVTGILIAFSIPPDIPLWIPAIGAFMGVVLIKQLFGGLGYNFINPALGARIILSISFPAQMTSTVMKSEHWGSSFLNSTDLISKATPISQLRVMSDAVSAATSTDEPYTYWEMFLGYKSGMLGEICILALLIGAAYLLLRGVINLYAPLAYIGAHSLFVVLVGQDPLYHLLSGGLILGAFFMATDYVTNPKTNLGQIIFGVGCGLLTALMRVFGAATGGVAYSIVLMNILTPHIDNLIVYMPRRRKARLAKTE